MSRRCAGAPSGAMQTRMRIPAFPLTHAIGGAARRPDAESGSGVNAEAVFDAFGDCEPEPIIGGAKTIGDPSGDPIEILSPSPPALAVPSGVRRVTCTARTSASAIPRRPGSGSLARPYAAIMEGG
jgi:hypothetical protein